MGAKKAGVVVDLWKCVGERRVVEAFGQRAGAGAEQRAAVFRDCVLIKKGSTVGDVYRKVMGDAPMAYVETVGGVRVSEEDEVAVGKNDASDNVQPA